MYRKWIYHETEEPKIIDYDDGDLPEGWAASPAQFIKLETMGINKDRIECEDESAKAQQALDAVEGVVASLNGELNLGLMSKKELTEYALEHFGLKLNQQKRKTALVEDIRNHIEA